MCSVLSVDCARAQPARGSRSGCARPAVWPGRARLATQATARAWCYRPYEPPTRAAAATAGQAGQVTARAGGTQPASESMVCFRVRLDPGPAAEFSARRVSLRLMLTRTVTARVTVTVSQLARA